jgi:2-methylcitrate dehydratase PrpD
VAEGPALTDGSAETISQNMRALAGYMSRASDAPLDPEIQKLAILHLIDTYAAMIAGTSLEAGKRGASYVGELGGTPEATVFGTAFRTTALNAALANGMAAHADETDGSHPPTFSHPDASLIPAVIALAEARHLPGTAVLSAIVLGYDVGTRILLALDPVKLFASGHFPASMGQLFASAAGSASLLGLDEEAMRHVLSNAAQQSSGIYPVFRGKDHVEKAFVMGGMPAHDGLAAALMVAHGFGGVEDVFSGDRNFFETFSHRGSCDLDVLTNDLGQEFEISRSAIKRWSVGGPIQAPLDLVHELVGAEDFRLEDLARLTVRLNPELLRVVNDRPMTTISLQFAVAIMLVEGDLTFAAIHDSKFIDDPRVVAAKDLITVAGDPKFGDGRSAAIDVVLAGGRTLSLETMAAKGSFRNPMTLEEVCDKARSLVGPILGEKRCEELLDLLLTVSEVDDMSQLGARVRV